MPGPEEDGAVVGGRGEKLGGGEEAVGDGDEAVGRCGARFVAEVFGASAEIPAADASVD